jgi:NitT/TauT family transport system permease protein
VNTLFGLQSADPGMHDLFTLHHASRATRLRKLMFPAALPAMFAGLRISAGLSVIGAIVGDFFFAKGNAGIGQLLKRFGSQAQSEQLLAAVIMSCALGVAVFLFFGWVQKRVIGRWYEPGALQ